MPDPVRVCIAGATGGVGRCLVRAVLRRDSFELTGAVARNAAGRDIGEAVAGEPCGVITSQSLDRALVSATDVLIDYTHPQVRLKHTGCAIDRRIPMVIGTTGFTRDELDELDRRARHAGIGLVTGNFSITAALLQHFALIAARHIPHWTVTDYCKPDKPDAPSGTARELAELMGEIGEPEYALTENDYIGFPASLGANIDGTRVHSIRLPGYTAGVEVRFGLDGERLTLQHEMGERNEIFVDGSLLAAREVLSRTGLIRGLDKLLFPDEGYRNPGG